MEDQNPVPTSPEPAAAQPATPAPAAHVPLPGTPETWPGAKGVYKYSRQAVGINLATILILGVLNYGISFGIGLVPQDQLSVSLLLNLVASVISVYLGIGIVKSLIEGVRGQKYAVDQALHISPVLALKVFGLGILSGLMLFVSFLLLIVPFFFIAPRLELANYFLIDKNLGVIEAIKASWAATKGNAGKVWGIWGFTFLLFLPALTIIGIPVAIYFLIVYSAATAVLYEFLGKQPASQPAADATQPPAPVMPSAPQAPTV